MTLWDKLIPESGTEENSDSIDEKITIFLTKNHAGIQVEAYHDSVFQFLRHAMDIMRDITYQVECDMGEKICLLNDWVDSLQDIKDKRFEEFKEKSKDD